MELAGISAELSLAPARARGPFDKVRAGSHDSRRDARAVVDDQKHSLDLSKLAE
jgi:hypothetical protein